MDKIGLPQVGQLEDSDLAHEYSSLELCGDKKFNLLLDFQRIDGQDASVDLDTEHFCEITRESLFGLILNLKH